MSWVFFKRSSASVPNAPSSNQLTLFVDSADDVLKSKDSVGTVVPLTGGSSVPLSGHVANSVVGRADGTPGDAADIQATTADTLLGFVGGTLAWLKLTLAMIPDGLITLAKMHANAADQSAATASLRTLGTSGVQACAGNDARLSDARAPAGTAGGQLGGTYPNPDVRGLRETAGPTTLTMGAVADGQVLVRSGSTIVGATSGATFDIRDILVWDHFITGNLDLDELGSAGWRTNVSGTGSGISTVVEAGHPGIVQLEGGTVLAGRAGIHLGESSALAGFKLDGTQGQIDNEWLIRLVGAATLLPANTERVTLGFGDAFDAASGVEHLDGVYAEFNPTDSAQWRLRTASAGTRSSSLSGVNAVADAWVRIGIRMTYPGGVPTAQLLINGTTVGAPLTTNIPSAAVGIGARIDSNAGLNSTLQVDYCLATQNTAKET